mmetsp:Transcript_39626/g.64257  ORF Transcript_39626/g.64257 Transcript_39626/m.64257 type:complete len:232 (-) Transcript_39626:321-1016(-)
MAEGSGANMKVGVRNQRVGQLIFARSMEVGSVACTRIVQVAQNLVGQRISNSASGMEVGCDVYSRGVQEQLRRVQKSSVHSMADAPGTSAKQRAARIYRPDHRITVEAMVVGSDALFQTAQSLHKVRRIAVSHTVGANAARPKGAPAKLLPVPCKSVPYMVVGDAVHIAGATKSLHLVRKRNASRMVGASVAKKKVAKRLPLEGHTTAAFSMVVENVVAMTGAQNLWYLGK